MGAHVMPGAWRAEAARLWLERRVSPVDARERALDAYERTLGRITPGVSDVVVTESDNAAYAGAWLATVVSGVSVWCANPKWGESEWREAGVLMPAGALRNAELGMRSAGAVGRSGSAELPQSSILNPQSAFVHIPTGGTGGRVRFVAHTRATLSAAVSGFSRYAGDRLTHAGRPVKLHAVQALPCFHVSGLMPVVRAWLTDAELVFTPPSFRPDEPLPEMPASADGLTVVSLVAAQLHRLLERADGSAWLREAGLVLVGGSAVAPELLDRARTEKLPLGVSYGLTEVAALAALYPPESFLRGEHPVAGELLPHIRASITAEGRVALIGESLAPGLPRDTDGRFVTGDEGLLDARGRLVVTGRADRIIISGGEKIDPAEVESAIRATGFVREVLVTGEPDSEWGRRVVAIYVGGPEESKLVEALRNRIAGHRVPRRWVRTEALPLDARGKIDHAALAALLRR